VPLLLRHPSSLEHDTGPSHPERADRIRAIDAELESRGVLGRAHPAEPGASREAGRAHPAEPGASREALKWDVREAPRATEEQLLRVHPPAYVERVREMSARSAPFDLDTPTSPGSYEAAARAAGGACVLVEALLQDGEKTGFSVLRPPGHHAEPERAMGFCLFATMAIAARHALDALGAERVLVLDWDVHHGNGTNTIFHESPEVLFASIHQYPFWPGTGALRDVGSGAGEGYSFNLPVPAGTGEAEFLSLVEHVVAPAALETGSYGQLARQVRDLAHELDAPVGAVLEGGYDLRALADSVAETMGALAGDEPSPQVARPDPLAEAAIGVLGRYWDF
jgi:acetoin utilization deacetylase AcuC-like enzyme